MTTKPTLFVLGFVIAPRHLPWPARGPLSARTPGVYGIRSKEALSGKCNNVNYKTPDAPALDPNEYCGGIKQELHRHCAMDHDTGNGDGVLLKRICHHMPPYLCLSSPVTKRERKGQRLLFSVTWRYIVLIALRNRDFHQNIIYPLLNIFYDEG